MKIALILLIISTYYLRINCKSSSAMRDLIITRVGPCVDTKKKTPITVSEMSLRQESHRTTLSGIMNISEDVENGWQVKANIQKCHDIRNLDTCDFFKYVNIVKDGCLHLGEENVYNMFFQYVTPKMECPIKSGQYSIADFSFYTEDTGLTAVESKISTSVFGYTYRLEGYIEDEKILCVEAHLRMTYIRKHDWVGDQKIHSYADDVTEAVVDDVISDQSQSDEKKDTAYPDTEVYFTNDFDDE